MRKKILVQIQIQVIIAALYASRVAPKDTRYNCSGRFSYNLYLKDTCNMHLQSAATDATTIHGEDCQ